MDNPSSIFLPAKPRVPRKRRQTSASEAPATGPVLVAAGYDDVTGTLALTFDRAIDLSGIVPASIVVLDGSVPIELAGTADVTPVGADGFSIVMIENGEYAGSGVLLNVPGGAGIVAAEGGAAWAG